MTYPDIQVVNDHDEIVGAAPFDEVYAKGLHHRISRILVEDGQGNMLLQKRGPNVKLYPNTWDVAAAGHVDKDEDYVIAAKRELQEETGIVADLQEVGKVEIHKTIEGRIINRFAMYYRVVINHDARLNPQEGEVADLEWFAVDEVMRMWREEPDSLADGLTDALEHFYN